MIPGGGTRTAPSGVEIEDRPGERWDAFARASPGGTFCHLAAWHGVVSEALGHEPLYLTARDADGGVEGILPLVAVRSRLFGRFLVSMPFLNYGGPLGSPAARERLAATALRMGRTKGVDLVELRCRDGARLEGSGAVGGFRAAERKVTVLLGLPDSPDTLWSEGLRSKVRSQIRRSMRAGCETRFGHTEIGPFYEVFARNMRDLGTPVLPRRLFDALPGAFGPDVVFGCVRRAGEPVAAGCGFRFGSEFEITWASALREHSRAAPNMLLYWRMMERAIRDGVCTFNFGRCTPGGGTHRFKRQWGGSDEPLPWRSWSPDGRLGTPSPDEGRYRIATEVWRRLPVGLTRSLGPPLARRIP